MKSGWVIKKLGEVCELIGGGTPSIHESSYYGGNIPWATVRDMNCRVIEKTERTITRKGLENSASNVIPAGNVIISTHVGLGKVCFVAQDTAINQDLKGVIPLADTIQRSFLYYWFLSIAEYLEKSGTGSTVRGVKLDFVKNLEFPVPSLPEQKRIVAKIDAAFEKIDKLKANAERNLANAKELFQSALDEAMRPKKGWVEKRLGEHYTITSSKRVFKDQWKNSGVPFYRAREIVRLARDGYVDNELFISEEMFKEYGEKYGLPRVDDIMITGVGTLGVCYVVKEDDRFYFKDGNIIWLKKNSRELDSRFVEYCFLTDAVKKQVHANHGTTVGTYTIEMAKATVVYAPSIEEQVSIANDCNLFRESFVRLQQNYTRQIADCAEMRQSVLRDAFEGRL